MTDEPAPLVNYCDRSFPPRTLSKIPPWNTLAILEAIERTYLGNIAITVVPPTAPSMSHRRLHWVILSDKHTDPSFYRTAWLDTVKEALDTFAKERPKDNQGLGEASWTLEGTWENSGLSIYMMTDADTKKWYSLLDPDSSKPSPSLNEFAKFALERPEFIVTVSTVSRQQRRGVAAATGYCSAAAGSRR
eukprot:GHVU01111870.1.p1 GENE.GHVU01111870.1~~GHVU01111870.1.p1  ORF type:complete len:190 (-),score=4.71 GHVU01111870.1:315-884(-)